LAGFLLQPFANLTVEVLINRAAEIQFKFDENLNLIHHCLPLAAHSEPVPQTNADKVWKVRSARKVETAP
jgi:hypothetical protein